MEKTVSVNGEQYFTRDTEKGEVSVLLLHGWPDDGTLWREQVDFLSKQGYRVICPDWLGHGKSSAPSKKKRYHRFRLAEDIIALLSALHIKNVHLVAHDYGATVAWEIATYYGQRFESFVALSVGHSVAILKELFSGHLFHYYWLILHGMPFARAYYLRNGAEAFHKKFAQHPDAQYVLDKLKGEGDKTFFTIWERANPVLPLLVNYLSGSTQKVPKISIPTMGIYSDEDVWMTEGQMKNSCHFVSAEWRYEIINSGGHWLPLEKSDKVNSLLKDWLLSH
jgi:pimeloyl-ACP methyl ester carboxylesterase